MNSIRIALVLLIIVIEGLKINGVFTNSKNCGKRSFYKENFVVGGMNARRNEFPFMVSLQFVKPDMETEQHHFCGASILNDRWILTAAHCLAYLHYFGIDANRIRIIIGKVDKNVQTYKKGTKLSADSETYLVDKWIINGCFLTQFELLSADIALIKTDRDINFSKGNVGTICLPPINWEPKSADVMVMGWGVTSQTMPLEQKEEASNIMQKIQTKLVSETYCWAYTFFRNMGLLSLPSKLGLRHCVKNDGSTACRGDSGGPLVQIVNGSAYNIGIASFISITLPIYNRCYKSNPILYTKTSKYIDWISNAIDRYGDSYEREINTKC